MKTLKMICNAVLALCLAACGIDQKPVNLDHSVKTIPASYADDAEEQGTVVRLNYQAHLYDTDEMIEKHCYVYLPYGYDEHPQQKYDILYFMHGGGSTAEKFLGGTDSISLNRKTLDHMIQDGLIKPMIVVTPSFYRNDFREDSLPNAGDLVKMFPRELTEELMPAVESQFRTYASSTSPGDLMAARDHRAFSGFSMGSVTTWWVFNKALDYFRYFIPLSGDCWYVQSMGGSRASEATADALAEVARGCKYGELGFFIFTMTGTEDMASNQLTPQVEAMKALPEFKVDDDFRKGNFYFSVLEGGKHESSIFGPHYIYTALPEFFPAE